MLNIKKLQNLQPLTSTTSDVSQHVEDRNFKLVQHLPSHPHRLSQEVNTVTDIDSHTVK